MQFVFYKKKYEGKSKCFLLSIPFTIILSFLTVVYTEKDVVIDQYIRGPTTPKLEGSHTEVPCAGSTIPVLLLSPHQVSGTMLVCCFLMT